VADEISSAAQSASALTDALHGNRSINVISPNPSPFAGGLIDADSPLALEDGDLAYFQKEHGERLIAFPRK
jgi:hypothetical protein